MEPSKNIFPHLFEYLKKDLMEFGISDSEFGERFIKNTLDPQNYREASLPENYSIPFLVNDNGIQRSSREYFIRKSLEEKIKFIIEGYSHLETPDLLGIFHSLKLNPEQIKAVESSLKSGFFILTGGPGTGKTTTAAAIIAAHILSGYPVDSILITAPTGRAAGRITESLLKSFNTLEKNILDENILKNLINLKASTVHRLLSYSHSKNKFYKNANNPLPSRLIILDEASMISPELFYHLLDAIPDDGKIILLGDGDQLPPVDSQKFFKPILDNSFFSNDSIRVSDNKISEHKKGIRRVHLETNHRTDSQNLIQFLSEIKSGSVKKKDWMEYGDNSDFIENFSHSIKNKFGSVLFLDNGFFRDKNLMLKFFESYRKEIISDTLKVTDEIQKVDIWERISTFQILCGLKQNARESSESINLILESKFNSETNLIPRIMTYNNYSLHIFNGDMGAEYGGKVYFPIDGRTEAFSTNLSGLESAFAITVHKSQGSQYKNVVLILPADANHELNTRAMLYTGASRTIQNLVVVGNQKILEEAVGKV